MQLCAYSCPVTSTDVQLDRRVALGVRHHEALIEATIELLERDGIAAFTVERLAERAGVSRRTVFNHFGSVDELLTVAGSRVIGNVIDGLMSHTAEVLATSDPRTIVAELLDVMRQTDVVTSLAYLAMVLGSGRPDTPWRHTLMVRTMSKVGQELSDTMRQRYPSIDPLDVAITIHSFLTAIVVVHSHWVDTTGAVDSTASREEWGRLIDRIVILMGSH